MQDTPDIHCLWSTNVKQAARVTQLHLLGRLVAPECQSSSSTLNDGARVEAAQNACLVVFGRVELGCYDIVRIREGGLAGRADTMSGRWCIEAQRL